MAFEITKNKEHYAIVPYTNSEAVPRRGYRYPGTIVAAGRMGLQQRLRALYLSQLEGENGYSTDVRPSIAWGIIRETTPNNSLSMDVLPAFQWGRALPASPNNSYNYQATPAFEWGQRFSDTGESKVSYDVIPEIMICEGTPVQYGFCLRVAPYTYRSTIADVVQATDRLMSWTGGTYWDITGANLTAVTHISGGIYLVQYTIGPSTKYTVFYEDNGTHTDGGGTAHEYIGMEFTTSDCADRFAAYVGG